jgi:SET family sugar efflux transporter-like MFS transporter
VISALVLAFAGGAGSQLFAALHDNLASVDRLTADGVVAVVRMALTAGWVVGPVCGAFLAATAGLRTMLFATALCLLGQLVPLIGQRLDTPNPTPHTHEHHAPRVGLRAMLPLLAFCGLDVCVYAGESVKYAFLPIYMNQQLRLDPAVSGAVIGIQPLVELVLMPLSILVANRVGAMRLMVVGAGFGVAANVVFATSGSAVGMFVGQIFMGGVWGVFAALGIIVAQRLLPRAVATASAIFMNCTAVASAIGGITGGLGAATIGLPHVFFVPAAFAAVATIGLGIMATTVSGQARHPDDLVTSQG